MKTIQFTAMLSALIIASAGVADSGHAHGPAIDRADAILSAESRSTVAAFDVLAAHVHLSDGAVTFHMTTRGDAGAELPKPAGVLGGAPVWSYVWPTDLDPATVGFDSGAGILAMAATNHPDFDDTPLYDESGDGDAGNDGGVWHSHWVVLAPNPACGPGALGVVDIPEGVEPALPDTWPGLPILIDSPGYATTFEGTEVSVTADDLAVPPGTAYDGVTAALRVNENIHAPLLCVTDVFDVASGDLSLPGRISD